jgi:hypothetical protein
MKHIKHIDTFLNEGRMDDTQAKYEGVLSDVELIRLRQMSENSSMYFEWLLKIYVHNNVMLDLLNDYFSKFLKIKKNLPTSDINKIKDFQSLINLVDGYNDFDKIESDNDIKLLLNNEKWLIFIPNTYNAAKKWGWSSFCTSHNEKYFEFHSVKETLVYIMHKFENQKNIVVQLYPDICYIWDYEDNCDLIEWDSIMDKLKEYDDGYLNISLGQLKKPSREDFIKHYARFASDNISLDDMNTILSIFDIEVENMRYSTLVKCLKNVDINIEHLKAEMYDYV